MKEGKYSIKAENGIHARPAGFLVKEVKKYKSDVFIETDDGKKASADKLFALMKLGIKQGDTINIIVDGEDEVQALNSVIAFMKENF